MIREYENKRKIEIDIDIHIDTHAQTYSLSNTYLNIHITKCGRNTMIIIVLISVIGYVVISGI